MVRRLEIQGGQLSRDNHFADRPERKASKL
jgi:hypothetical protein